MLFATTASALPPLNLPFEDHRLDNGLRIVLAPDDALPDVTVRVCYRVGEADDPDGLPQLAHVVEHLLANGSRDVPPEERARFLESHGATNLSATTSADRTCYAETVGPEQLDLALWFEKNRMALTYDTIDEAAVRHEVAIVEHEYRYRVFDTTFGSLFEFISNEVFPAWHPYHLPLGLDHVVGDIHLRDVHAFLRTWYMPDNAIVVIAGHFDAAAAMRLASAYFQSIPVAASPVRPTIPRSWHVGDVHLGFSAPIIRDQVTMAWQTPAFREDGDRALDLAAEVLAGPDGLLIQRLVRTGLAVSVSARQSSRLRGSLFTIVAVAADGTSAETVAGTLENAVREVRVEIDETRVVRARERWMRRTLAMLETSAGRAARLGTEPDAGDPWDLEAYTHVDGPGVGAALRRYLVPETQVEALIHRGRVPAGMRGVLESREQRLP